MELVLKVEELLRTGAYPAAATASEKRTIKRKSLKFAIAANDKLVYQGKGRKGQGPEAEPEDHEAQSVREVVTSTSEQRRILGILL